MSYSSKSRCKLRNIKGGGTIAEFPPALILLLVFIFFPLIEFLYVAIAYGAGWYLNQIEMRQIACTAPPCGSLTAPSGSATTYSAGTATQATNLPQSTAWNGFMGAVEDTSISPQVTYFPVTGGASNQVGAAQVQTTVTVNPFFSVNFPWLPKCPGLNEPWTFVYTNTIYQEEGIPLPCS